MVYAILSAAMGAIGYLALYSARAARKVQREMGVAS